MASLSSSEESSKKKLDSKTGSGERQTFRIYIYPTKSGSGAASTVTDKSCEAEDEKSNNSHLGKTSDSSGAPESRPSSSAGAAPTPDISCSPIVSHAEVTETDGNKMEDGGMRLTKKTSTSTPVPAKKTLMSSLSSPQKMIRKKATEARNRHNLSDDEDIEEARQERVKKPKKSPPDDTFKDPGASPAPAPGSQTISFSVTDLSALDSAQFKEALEMLKSIGIVQSEAQPAVKKRLSDQSTLSLGEDTTSKQICLLMMHISGGSSGYLGGSSSGITSSSSDASKRSRLSIMPETKVERHKVISKLPSRPSTAGENNLSEDDTGSADKKEVLTDGEANESVTSASKQKREESNESSSAASSLTFIADLPSAVPVKTPGKRGRKRKDPDVKKKESETVKSKDSDKLEENDTTASEEQEAEVEDGYKVNSQVFAK